MALYETDLAHVHATGFGGFAAGAMPAIVERLRSADVRTVVDVGCGAGVSTRALVDAGFDVLAVDPSAALLEIARRTAPAARFLQTSAYDVELPRCDAILAIGEPLSYHAAESDAEGLLRRFVGRAANALRPSGHLVFDLIVSEGPSLDAKGWTSGEDWVVLHETREVRAARRLTRTVETFRRIDDGTYRRAREVHEVRPFDEALVVSLVEDAGFDVETARSYGSHALLTRRVAFLATRRGG